MNFLFKELKQQKENENLQSIDLELVYRASDHGYRASKFHELCKNKGATITIIHNEFNHIFGGYTSKSWSTGRVTDPNAFLFQIRPILKIYPFKEDKKKEGRNATWSLDNSYGPIFGGGTDMWISDNCNEGQANACCNSKDCSFKFDAKELSGAHTHSAAYECYFSIIDYEVFSIDIS